MDRKWMRYYAVLSSAALAKFLLCLGAAWAGMRLDQHWNTAPLFMLVFLVAAMGLGIAWIVLLSQKLK